MTLITVLMDVDNFSVRKYVGIIKSQGHCQVAWEGKIRTSYHKGARRRLSIQTPTANDPDASLLSFFTHPTGFRYTTLIIILAITNHYVK